jgi:hypothetical protein
MIKIVDLIDYVRQNFILVSVAALLAGTGWVLFALTFALFRDTIEPSGFAAHASTHRTVYHRAAQAREMGEYYWFRQRKLEPYATPVEHARNE